MSIQQRKLRILTEHNSDGTHIAGVLDVNTTQYSTPADTDTHDAVTYTLPAGTLSIDGKTVRVKAFGEFAANGNTKTVGVNFGTTGSLFTASSTPNNTDWTLEVDIIRTGVGGQKTIGFVRGVTTTSSGRAYYWAISEDETVAIDIAITVKNGTATAGDVVFEGMIVELLN